MIVCDRILRCAGWERSAKQIFDAQKIIAANHRIEYTGDIFKYCPWCGKEIFWTKTKSLDD